MEDAVTSATRIKFICEHFRLEEVWCAWMICHANITLPKCDARNLKIAVDAGIVFG